MNLCRVLRPFLSSLPFQSASYFPEKKNPPFWLENLTQSGHKKKFPDIYPWEPKAEPLKLLPGDDPQPYQPFIQKYTHRQKQMQKKMEWRRKKMEQKSVVKGDELKLVVQSNNIMGSWKKLHPITKQIMKKPLDHAILQCCFNSTWSPRYKDTMITLLNARQIAQDNGFNSSDLWIDNAGCFRDKIDSNGITVHAKGRQGSLKRRWSSLRVTVIKGRPRTNSKVLHDFAEQHHEHYQKFLPPLPIVEDATFR